MQKRNFLGGMVLILGIGAIIMKMVRGKKTEGNHMEKVEAIKEEVNANINDVADWFMLKGAMSNKKVQKLCYYAQAWSLALYDSPIATDSKFEAWVHGPVNKTLWNRFKCFGWSEFQLTEPERVREILNTKFSESQNKILESVWETYGEFSADELEKMTHEEKPWLEKRKGIGKFESCNDEISESTMKEYYRSRVIE
ncbi:Panacea domain-containing protein [Candidatus Stoquefichus sp. SB1]|uniref:Panacea domain-containing protein n=1 Tax=Candidatus Stoquefichus sp. SB1 TaxID=1658109 RepID=UPI00067EA9A0|nr:type II toxin-antitoxin system antitoxin SocA domain-containing protein [Candidatus Stoquefichus sp. SB1]